MASEVEEISERLSELAEFEDGDLFYTGDNVLAVKRRYYDFDRQTFYYQMKDVDWDYGDSDFESRKMGPYEQSTLERWQLIEDFGEFREERDDMELEPLQFTEDEL